MNENWLQRSLASLKQQMRGWPKWKREAASKDPHLGLQPQQWVCALCGADAKFSADGTWRHARRPFEDQSTFCDKYGYPIPIKAKDG